MAHFSTALDPTQGFHTTSITTINLPPANQETNCTLHLHLPLPPSVFADPHELAQRGASYTFQYWGSRDLEKPVHALPEQENEVLIGDVDMDRKKDRELRVEIPLHLRYGAPVNRKAAYEDIRLDWPVVFFHCLGKANPSIQPNLPPHILSALPQHPASYQIAIPSLPLNSNLNLAHNTIQLPLGSTPDLPIVELGTMLTILLCFIWLVRVSWEKAASLRLDSSSSTEGVKEE